MLCDELTKDDVKTLVFQCRDYVSRSKLENVADSYTLFTVMEKAQVDL